MTRDLLAIAKFLLNIIMTDESETFVIKSRIYMVSLPDFINFASQTDDIQDVCARIVGGKVTY